MHVSAGGAGGAGRGVPNILTTDLSSIGIAGNR